MNDEILGQHYSNYLEILANIKDRPRLPLPDEIVENKNDRKQKRIRWIDRPLTRSSSSDQIYGVRVPVTERHSDKPLCNLAANHIDSLQLQHNKERCSKPLKCKRHKTHKLRRSASTNTIGDVGCRRPENSKLQRNVSCRQGDVYSSHDQEYKHAILNKQRYHQHHKYQLDHPKQDPCQHQQININITQPLHSSKPKAAKYNLHHQASYNTHTVPMHPTNSCHHKKPRTLDHEPYADESDIQQSWKST